MHRGGVIHRPKLGQFKVWRRFSEIFSRRSIIPKLGQFRFDSSFGADSSFVNCRSACHTSCADSAISFAVDPFIFPKLVDSPSFGADSSSSAIDPSCFASSWSRSHALGPILHHSLLVRSPIGGISVWLSNRSRGFGHTIVSCCRTSAPRSASSDCLTHI